MSQLLHIESKSFKFKIRTIGKAPADGNLKDVKIVILLKYLSIFLRTPEIALTLMWVGGNFTPRPC